MLFYHMYTYDVLSTLTVAVPEIWDILEIQNENLLRSPKFYGENCDSTEPGTTFLKICLDLAYSIDSKKGLTFENPTFNSWLISKIVFD